MTTETFLTMMKIDREIYFSDLRLKIWKKIMSEHKLHNLVKFFLNDLCFFLNILIYY